MPALLVALSWMLCCLAKMHLAEQLGSLTQIALQDTATTCRERCGGQGYLSVNRFGAILGFAHAGMTAEGDNRVLMQKVCPYTASNYSSRR